MSRYLNLGIIGFGGFGNFILNALRDSDLYRVTAIADSFKKAEEVPSGISFSKDWKSLLEDDTIEAVLISTPPDTHAELAIAFLKAGKHVMCEKPLAISAASAMEIKKTADEFGRVVMVDFMQRFNPILKVLRNLYMRNFFGDFERYWIENYAQDESLPPNHWFWDINRSGGILLEHAVHFIDLVHWFGPTETADISGWSNSRNPGQTDQVAAMIHYKNGLMASHYHSFTRPNVFERTRMRFVFTTAQFDIDGWIPQSGHFTLLGNENLLAELEKLPNLDINRKEPITANKVRGKTYSATHLVEGSFHASESKKEWYAMAIQKIFEDFYRTVRLQNHQPGVSLADAIRAVSIAEEATNSAHVLGKDLLNTSQ